MTSPDKQIKDAVRQRMRCPGMSLGAASIAQDERVLDALIAALLQESQEAITRWQDVAKAHGDEAHELAAQLVKAESELAALRAGRETMTEDQSRHAPSEANRTADLRGEAFIAGWDASEKLHVDPNMECVATLVYDAARNVRHEAPDYPKRKALEAYLAAAGRETPAPAWLPIESAPKDGTTILLWYPGLPAQHDGYCTSARWADFGFGSGLEGWAENDRRIYNQPTHWMPLPAPPSSSEADRP